MNCMRRTSNRFQHVTQLKTIFVQLFPASLTQISKQQQLFFHYFCMRLVLPHTSSPRAQTNSLAHTMFGTNRILIKPCTHRVQIKCKYNRIDGWICYLHEWHFIYHFHCVRVCVCVCVYATDFKMQLNEAKIVMIKSIKWNENKIKPTQRRPKKCPSKNENNVPPKAFKSN